MDEQPIFTNPIPNIPVTHQAEQYLHSVKKWTRFLSVIGFVGVAFMFFFAIMMVFGGGMAMYNSDIAAAGGAMAGMMGGIYLVSSLLYFFPVLYLYKFSNTLDKCLVNRSGNYLEEAFKHLKSLFQFIGILTILTIIFVLLMLVITIFFAVAVAG